MTRRKDFKAAITYTGQKISGEVEVTLKVDGVRVLCREGIFVTRNNKTPPGLHIALNEQAKRKIKYFGDCEVYAGSFVASNSPLQQHEPTPDCLTEDMVYPLDLKLCASKSSPSVDPRLVVATVNNPTAEQINKYLQAALVRGYEGLVLRSADRWYRVKPVKTADVFITGWFEQFDKHGAPKGQLGGFNTNYGRVTAFTEDTRQRLWDNPCQYIGRLIEVQYKELFPSGNFRYTVKFLRFRDDKDTESFDTKSGVT